MSNENELLEPLATEAGQQAIARAINNLGSLENAVRAERAAATATQKADEARNSADDASDSATEARNWATKTDGYVDQETITIPPEQEGDEPTTETIDLYSARYYAALAQDIYNNLQFDTEPTENSTALVSSGAIYTALNGKADKSDTYTKTEVDTALGNVQSTLTFDNVPTANSDNPVKSSGIKTALDGKQDNLTFDSTPTANSNNPVTSGGIYTALQNVNIDIDDEITEDSDNPVTSAAIYEALQNFTPSGGGDIYNGDVFVSGTYIDTNNLIQNIYNNESSWDYTAGIKVEYTATQDCFVCGYLANGTGNTVNKENYGINVYINDVFIQNITHSSTSHSVAAPINLPLKKGDVFKVRMLDSSIKGYLNVFGVKHGDVVSEQMYSNVLYFNDGGVQTGTITLNDDFDNYDFIEFVCGYSSATYSGSRDDIGSYIASVEQIKDRNHFFVSDWGERTLTFNFDLTNRKQVILGHSGNADVFKIIGHKMAKGGYSGIVSDARMTVKSGFLDLSSGLGSNTSNTFNISFDSPMPDDDYIVLYDNVGQPNGYGKSLITTKDKTANGFTFFIYQDGQARQDLSGSGFSWIAIRPNSYTREGMVEDVLFSNASGVDSGTINLSGNISDYDLIDIQCVNKLNDGQSTNMRPSNIFASSQLLENLQNGNFLGIWGAVRSGVSDTIKFKIASDSSIYFDSQSCVNLAITKVVGIKYGRYVSGVTVDTTVTQNSNAVVTSGAVYDALQNIPSGGGSSSITVDTEITETSQNPVVSQAIYNALYMVSRGNRFPRDQFSDITPNDMLVQNKDELLYTHNDRQYYKKNKGAAAACLMVLNGWVSAVLVSDQKDAVIAYSSLYPQYQPSEPSEIIINNIKYYYSTSLQSYQYSGGGTIHEEIRKITSPTFENGQQAAEYIILNCLLSNDRTLAEYKITDAYTKTEVDTLIQNAGGSSSITVDSTITQGGTNPVEGGAIYTALGDKADKSTTYTKTEVDTALGNKQGTLTFDTAPTSGSSNPVTSGGVYTALQNLPTGTGDVTTNTDQNITGTKTFVGSKKVAFKQSTANDKLGFTLYGNTGAERGYLEFNPTNTVDGVAGLMTLGNYATSAASLTQVGFRRYSNISGASGAYNLLMPMVADARTPFSLTTTYQNFYLPLGFTDGTTTVRTAKSGLVDLSPLLASLEARIAALEGN